MKRTLVAILLTALLSCGCSFNRSDFVAGPNGQADQSQMSDSGRSAGPFVRGLLGGTVSASKSY
jgi:nitrous oxide reductase accessory protein NosL